MRELSVFGEFAEAEIERLVLGLIRDPFLLQHADHLDHLRDVVRGRGEVLRPFHAQRAEVVEERILELLREIREPHAELSAAADRLVVHVGEIHHAFDLEAARLQMPLQQVLEDVGAEISDVREIVNSRPACVELHAVPVGIERAELFDLSAVGVEKSRRHERATVVAPSRVPQLRSSHVLCYATAATAPR